MQNTVTIHARTERCRCGCKGRDPWHARTFKRVVTTDADGRSWAQLPWGRAEVREIVRGVWEVAR